MQNKDIQINTLTPIYDKIEDRIRLSINYQDLSSRIDIMITRDFILKIVPAIEEYIYKHYPNEPILEDEEITIQTNDSEQKDNTFTATSAEDFELYKNIEDLLVTLNLNFDKNTNLTSLSFITKNKYTASLNLNAEMIKNILKSLKNSIPKLSWGVSI